MSYAQGDKTGRPMILKLKFTPEKTSTILIIFYYLCFSLTFISCNNIRENNNTNKVRVFTENMAFKNKLDEFVNYLDSNECKENGDLIQVVCQKRNDSLIFNLMVNGGFNDLILWQDQFITTLTYRENNFIILNDFPNEIVKLKSDNYENIESVLFSRFNKEYNKFKKDSLVGPPWIIDMKSMELIFQQGKLIAHYFSDSYFPHYIRPEIDSNILEINKWLKPDTIKNSWDKNYVYDSTALVEVDESPKFVGGKDSLNKFISKTIIYPKEALKRGIEGRVFVAVVIDENGSVSNVQILRGIGSGCEEEAIRVVKLSPKWIPGKKNGKDVRVSIAFPVTFEIKNK